MNKSKVKQLGGDPKGAIGATKTPLQLLPPVFLEKTSWALRSGAIKYGQYNWRTSGGVESQTYIGALLRHVIAWQSGETYDPESGQNHLAHAAAGLAILMDAEDFGTLIDNRPPRKPRPILTEKGAKRKLVDLVKKD